MTNKVVSNFGFYINLLPEGIIGPEGIFTRIIVIHSTGNHPAFVTSININAYMHADDLNRLNTGKTKFCSIFGKFAGRPVQSRVIAYQ